MPRCAWMRNLSAAAIKLEQGMSAVGAALELGVELCTQMEVTAGQLHGLHQTAIRLVPEMTSPASSIS